MNILPENEFNEDMESREALTPYQLVVDGCDTYRGERLPFGTEVELLKWMAARYQVMGELSLSRPKVEFQRCIYVYIFDPSGDFWCRPCSSIKRYLVLVDGEEKMFVLREVTALVVSQGCSIEAVASPQKGFATASQVWSER